MSQHEDEALAWRLDGEKVAEYEQDPENVSHLDDALHRARFRRDDQDLRCEIGRRTIAALRQRARKDFPGRTRRERLLPWAPEPPDEPEACRDWADALIEAGVGRVLAEFVAGLRDELPGMEYADGMARVVRLIRGAIERQEIERSLELEQKFREVLCPYWVRAFEKDRREIAGVVEML